MRNSQVFQTYVLLMIFLTFAMPFITTAEQHTVGDPIADAERDAEQDISKVGWFNGGLWLSGIGIGCCALGVLLLVPVDVTDLGDDSPASTFAFAASILIPAAGLAMIYQRKTDPLAYRLIGKSPEYVQAYTDAYISKTRLIRTKSAAAGIGVGCGAAALGILAIALQ